MAEVRISHLHPRELRERSSACALAWLPLGTLEWHGHHLPLGVDGILSEAIARRGAEQVGGVAFPACYYGDHRGIVVEALATPESWGAGLSFDHRSGCAQEMGVSAAGIVSNAVRDQARRAFAGYVELIERAFWMIRAYGFSRIVSVSGHGGGILPAAVAIERFNQQQSACEVLQWDPFDPKLAIQDQGVGMGYGSHADAGETSMMLDVAPELVHVDRLVDDRPEELLGVAGNEHPSEAYAERGATIIGEAISRLSEALGTIPPPTDLRVPDEDGTGDEWVEILRPLFEAKDDEQSRELMEALIRAELAPPHSA